MKDLFYLLAILWLGFALKIADKFVDAKINNDTSIAQDTKRIADALDGKKFQNDYFTYPFLNRLMIMSTMDRK